MRIPNGRVWYLVDHDWEYAKVRHASTGRSMRIKLPWLVLELMRREYARGRGDVQQEIKRALNGR